MRGTRLVLAVLPFGTASGDAGDDVLSRGFVADLTAEFARFASLDVIAPLSSIAVAAMTDVEAAERLGATHLLRGRFQHNGDRLRIAATLVDGATGTQIWSEKLEAPEGSLFDMQDELIARIAATLTARMEETTLRHSRRKPPESLSAYELTLRGFALVRQGSAAADEEARGLFERALDSDPHYARAHAGLSLSWFNAWSYTFSDRFRENWQMAYSHAHKSLELDDGDALQHLILGRLLLFHREFDRASWYFDRALMLCPNNADILIWMALNATFLGRPEEGLQHALKAMRLNPYHPNEYYIFLSFPQLLLRDFDAALATIGKVTDLSAQWKALCVPAYKAIALANTGALVEAREQFALFVGNYRAIVTQGREPEPGEASAWLLRTHPYQRLEDIDFITDGFRKLGDAGCAPTVQVAASSGEEPPRFLRQGRDWLVSFAGEQAFLPDGKGITDIRRLIETPFEEIHCVDLAGRDDAYAGDDILDDKARQSLKLRIRDLQEELAEAEDHNDVGRAERLRNEMDQLVETLSSALGLGGKGRRLGSMAERARTTVTWRIRNAIRKIEPAHETLARHFQNSIRTGTFCSYQPEQPTSWKL